MAIYVIYFAWRYCLYDWCMVLCTKESSVLSYDLAYLYCDSIVMSFHRNFIFYVGGEAEALVE